MKKFRLFFTILFLLSTVVIILLITIYDKTILLRAADLIRHHIWPAGIALLIFLGLLSAGIVSNLAKSDGSLFSNGYFQLAILELFLLSAGLAYFGYYFQQPGRIVLRLEPENTREVVNLVLKFQSANVTTLDTVQAPAVLSNRPAGKYKFETLDQDLEYYQADVMLASAEVETLVIPVILNTKTLTVQTEPPGAEIRINGLQASHTPYHFNVLSGDTVILELRMEGYQIYQDTLHLTENVDLGIIPLQKLYSLWISSRYDYTAYKIYDKENAVIFSGNGSRKLQLTKGKYRIAYEIGEGQYDTKAVLLNYNMTITIP